MRENWGRSLRNLADYNLLNNELIKFDRSEEALLRGVTTRRPEQTPANFAQTLTKNETKRLSQIKRLQPMERSTLQGLQSLVTVFTEEVNKALSPEYILKRGDDVGRAMRQIRDSQGVSLSRESFVTLSIDSRSEMPSRDKQRRDKQRVPFHWVPHKQEYRDPRGNKADPIHRGANPNERWYAITEISLFGRRHSAGRKGSEYEGLGYQPLGRDKQYRSFVRVGYPARSTPDRLTTQHQFSLFQRYWQDPARVEKVLGPVKDNMLSEINLYIQQWRKKVRAEARIISRKV